MIFWTLRKFSLQNIFFLLVFIYIILVWWIFFHPYHNISRIRRKIHRARQGRNTFYFHPLRYRIRPLHIHRYGSFRICYGPYDDEFLGLILFEFSMNRILM